MAVIIRHTTNHLFDRDTGKKSAIRSNILSNGILRERYKISCTYKVYLLFLLFKAFKKMKYICDVLSTYILYTFYIDII